MGGMMPRLFIFGDSTAAAKEDKARPETGWGECFSRYLSRFFRQHTTESGGEQLKIHKHFMYRIKYLTSRENGVLIKI